VTTPGIRIRTASCAAILAPLVPFAGCGQAAHLSTPAPTRSAEVTTPAPESKALQKYIAALQPSIPSAMKRFDDLYSDFTISAAEPSTMVYEYTFARQVDPAKGRKGLEGMVPTLKTLCDTQVFPEMKLAGIKSPKVRYTYINADGSRLWSKTFKAK
jgi:hypothetical protein